MLKDTLRNSVIAMSIPLLSQFGDRTVWLPNHSSYIGAANSTPSPSAIGAGPPVVLLFRIGALDGEGYSLISLLELHGSQVGNICSFHVAKVWYFLLEVNAIELVPCTLDLGVEETSFPTVGSLKCILLIFRSLSC
eukprot:5702012-Amphidinium_carterae.1